MILSKKFVCRSKNLFYCLASKMSTSSEDSYLEASRKLLPSLTAVKHKGQDGRIGIVGGSLEYSGAPYFAGMAALRTGADLVHIFCCREASGPIKSFSPELIVHPVLDTDDALSQIEPWLDRLHVLLIGPGLGRDSKVFETVSKLVETCRRLTKPLVIDADGLFLISQNKELVRNYPGVILTPNAMEFSRLAKAYLNKDIEPSPIADDSLLKELAEKIGERVVVLQKGSKDVIGDGRKNAPTISCGISGSGRRCAGQGDILSGAISVFNCWAQNSDPKVENVVAPMIACYAACRLVRECNAAAFKVHHRGMLAHDMLAQITSLFDKYFET